MNLSDYELLQVMLIRKRSIVLEQASCFAAAPEQLKDTITIAAADSRCEGHPIIWTPARIQYHVEAIRAFHVFQAEQACLAIAK